MQKVNPRFKTIVALFLLLFLFGSTVIIVNNVSKVREPVSQAATKTITIGTDFDGQAHSNGGCLDSNNALQVGVYSGGGGYTRPYIRFNLSSLPDDASISDVDLVVNIYTIHRAGATVDVQAYNQNGKADPKADSCATRGARSANDASPYLNNITTLRSTGRKTLRLPVAANTDVENAKAAVNRFSIGINEDGTPTNNLSYLDSIESAGTNEPKLVITYTTSPPPPPPPPPPNGDGGDGGNGSDGGGTGTDGGTSGGGGTTGGGSGTGTSGGITGIISSIKVSVNPPTFLVGKLDATLKVKDVSKKIKLSSSTSSFTIPVDGALAQGLSYTLVFSGKKFVDKSVKFKATSSVPTVSVGNLVFGDIDGNEKVDNKDMSLFNSYAVDNNQKADLNLDQAVNALDYSALLTGLVNKGGVNKIEEKTHLSLFANTDGAKLGEEFTVDVIAETDTIASDGVDIQLTYDPSKLFLKDIRKTSAFDKYPVLEGYGGTVRITALTEKAKPVSGSNVVATLVFEAIEKGTTEIKYTLTEPFSADNNIAGHFSGSDTLGSVDNLKLDISSEGITATTERVGINLPSNRWLLYLVYFTIALIVLGAFGWYIKRGREKTKEAKVFTPEEVPLDKLPPKA